MSSPVAGVVSRGIAEMAPLHVTMQRLDLPTCTIPPTEFFPPGSTRKSGKEGAPIADTQLEQMRQDRVAKTIVNSTINRDTPLGGIPTPLVRPMIRAWDPKCESPMPIDIHRELHDSTEEQMTSGIGLTVPARPDGLPTQGASGSHERDQEDEVGKLPSSGDARELAIFAKSIGAHGSIPPTPESWKNPNPANIEEARLAYERQAWMHQTVIAAREGRNREDEVRPKPTRIHEVVAISATVPPTPTKSDLSHTASVPPLCVKQQSTGLDSRCRMAAEDGEDSEEGSQDGERSIGLLSDITGGIEGPTNDGSSTTMDVTGDVDIGKSSTGKEEPYKKKSLNKEYMGPTRVKKDRIKAGRVKGKESGAGSGGPSIHRWLSRRQDEGRGSQIGTQTYTPELSSIGLITGQPESSVYAGATPRANGMTPEVPELLEDEEAFVRNNLAAKPIDIGHEGTREPNQGGRSPHPNIGNIVTSTATLTDEPRSPSRRALTRSGTRFRRSFGGISPGRNPFRGSPLKRLGDELPTHIGTFTSRNPRVRGNPCGPEKGAGERLHSPNQEQLLLRKWLEGIGRERRPLALISGCDGTHAARIAVQDEVGRPDIVVIMESDVAKRAIVCEKFGYPIETTEWQLTKDGVLAMILGDVWQVLHAHGRVLKELVHFLQVAKDFTNVVPVIISMWGTSCQDLTAYAEGHAGAAGYAGRRSVLMHAAHLTQWVLQKISHDMILLPMMENAGSTRKEHLIYLNKLWKNCDGRKMEHYIRAGDCTESARNRFYHTGFPKDSPMIPRAQIPWDKGWRHNLEGTGRFPPWMRTREYEVSSTGDPLYSTLFYHPKHLLLKDDFYEEFVTAVKVHPEGYRVVEDRMIVQWNHPHTIEIVLRWGKYFPEHIRHLWTILVHWKCETAGKLSKEEEKALVPLKTWIEGDDGRTCPFRTPRPIERLRDCGLEDYFSGSERLVKMATKTVIGNMTGDIFKPCMWKMVWRSPTGATLKGIMFRHPGQAGVPPITTAGDPGQTIEEFGKLCREITNANPEYEKYLADSPYYQSRLDITSEPATWEPFLQPITSTPTIRRIVIPQATETPALALMEGKRAQKERSCLLRTLPEIHIPEQVCERLHDMVSKGNHRLAWVHGADHGHVIRNLVAAMCLCELSKVSDANADGDLSVVPYPLEDARMLEQSLARKAGQEIFLGQCKLSLPAKIGLVADAAKGVKLVKWGCLLLTGKVNEETARWEAEAMHPASEWHPHCIIVVDLPHGLAVLGEANEALEETWTHDRPFYNYLHRGIHQIKTCSIGIKPCEEASVWITRRGGIWLNGAQSTNFQSCLIVAVFSAISGEHWSLKKGSLHYAIVMEIVSKGVPLRGRTSANCLEYTIQLLLQLRDITKPWLETNEARAHDARPLLHRIRTDKDLWIVERVSAGTLCTSRIGRAQIGTTGEEDFPSCIHISGETVRAARWLPDALITERVREQRKELFKQDLRAATTWAGNGNVPPPEEQEDGGRDIDPHRFSEQGGGGREEQNVI